MSKGLPYGGDDDDDKGANLIPRKADLIVTSEERRDPARRGLFRTIGVWLGFLRDYTAEDIDRLKEAGVSRLEGETRQRHATADKLLADAAEKQSQAALTLAKRAESAANAEATLINAKGNYAKNMAEAVERVASAIQKLNECGGSVSFSGTELLKLLDAGSREFPGDKDIKAGDVESASGEKEG